MRTYWVVDAVDTATLEPAVFALNTKFHGDARIWAGSTRPLING